MSSFKQYRGNGQQGPEPISRTSSITVLSPIVKDGVGEIATMLGDMDGILDTLDAEVSPDAGHVPDVGELLKEIAKLHKDVKSTKLAQDDQIRKIRDDVKDDTKIQIVQLTGGKIKSIIEDEVAVQVKKEVEEWGKKPAITQFVGALEKMVVEDNKILTEALTQLGNSNSRHANSTLDVQSDFNTPLGPIKHHDGHISELFPTSLRELFSYDPERLIRLLREYGLHPLDKHNENLNRLLLFIGVSAAVPDQLVDFSEEMPPAYPVGNITWLPDERVRASARRRSSASEKGAGSWYGTLFG